ncbi:MAG: efflux transporter outer membrane subunit [Woeseiaceae bacterium]
MRRLPVVVTLTLFVAGCNVGPDYERVNPALPDQFVSAVESSPGSSPASMWALFEEPELAALIDTALTRNARLAQASATLAESRALSGLRIFSLFPTVTVNADPERTRQSASDPFGFGTDVVERYRAGFDAVWEIDLFGSLRRDAEAIVRQTEADLASLYAVQVSIAAETAQTYFQWRGAVVREQLLQQNITNQGRNVEILEAALEAGSGTLLDVSRARVLERSIAATLPSVRASRQASLQRLAVLTGQSASEVRDQLTATERMPSMPSLQPLGKPSEWLARRPDIVAAERQLAQRTAKIGVATAELYPKLNLVGDFGWTGRSASDLGDGDADRWRFAPALSWRILDYGRVRQGILVAEAQTANALAVFEQTWRTAIEETENALANYRAASETAVVLGEALTASRKAVEIARLRFDNGADSFLTVLDAERTDLELQDQSIVAAVDRASALAALYKAFGGSFAEVELPLDESL